LLGVLAFSIEFNHYREQVSHFFYENFKQIFLTSFYLTFNELGFDLNQFFVFRFYLAFFMGGAHRNERKKRELILQFPVDYAGSKFSLPKMATNLGHQILIFTILRGRLCFFEIPPFPKISMLRPS
jgi:hypothetical protein